MLRIATSTAFDNSVANLQRRQAAMTDSQIQLTSGKRVARPSDDPAAAAVIERALATATRSDGQLRALDAARTAMSLTESALGDGVAILQSARELVLAAGNAGYTDDQRKSLAQNLKSLRDDLLNVANRGAGSGRYLFGGQGSDGPPLRDVPGNPGAVDYNGTAGGMQAATGEPMPLALDGRAVWLQAPDPRNAGAVLSIFDTLDSAIRELGTPGRASPQVAQTVGDGLAGIDAAMGNLSSWRSAAGEALNRADSIGSRLSQSKLDAQVARSNAEDLDMVQAVSDFQSQQSGYSAALKTYSLVQRMSLFDYIK